MPRTLLITNSYDHTSDLLVEALGQDKVFRVNFDLIKDYCIELSATDLSISVADNSIMEDEISKCIWRKAFNGEEYFQEQLGRFAAAEYKYALREILNICESSGKLVFNRHDAQNECGKLSQLRLSAKFFTTPDTIFISTNAPFTAGSNHVVKSLSSTPFDNGDVLYTTDVSGKQLSANQPWQIQEKIDATADVTVVYAYGRIFSFSLPRDSFEGLDWRKHIFSTGNRWSIHKLTEAESNAIHGFMKAIGWNYARLDFLISKEKLIFLEVNANGQWAWLDNERENGLFNYMLTCIDPNTPMPSYV